MVLDGSQYFGVLEMTPHPSAESSLPPRGFGCLLGTRFMCCRLKVNAMVRECRPFRGSVIPGLTVMPEKQSMATPLASME